MCLQHAKATPRNRKKRECETSLHVPYHVVYGLTASLLATYLYGIFEGCPRCLLLFSSLQASATRRGARGAPASVGHGRTGRGGRTARARAGCVGCAASERAAREAGGCRGCRGCRRGAARGVCGVWSGVRAPVVEAEARAKHHSAATSFAREHAQHAGWGLDRAARRRVERM